MWSSGYAKAVFAVLGAVLVVVSSALTDNIVNLDERVAIAVALVNAVTTYVIPNLSSGVARHAKSIAAGLLAVLAGLTGWMVDGMSYADWVNLVIAFATAAGIFLAPAPKHAASNA
jgi:hypothetical protein